jgi:hypothetical protein
MQRIAPYFAKSPNFVQRETILANLALEEGGLR